MAVIIGSIKQESNSFCAVPMTLRDFQSGFVYCGEEILEKLKGTKTGDGGFMDVLAEEGKQPAPTIAAMPASSSGGIVTAETSRYLQEELLDRIKAFADRGEAEGVLLNLHGAMITEDCDDFEGDTAEKVRAIVGPSVPIAVSLDGHAFVSDLLLENADILVGYSTFPHVDEYGTGVRAARLLMQMIRKKIQPQMQIVRIPMLLSPEAELDSQPPLSDILKLCRNAESEEAVLSATFFPVQPWMDVPGLASAVLIITDGNAALGKEMAQKIAVQAWSLRHQFVPEHLEPGEAVRKALAAERGPVILSEVGDAPPAGAPGDSNCLLKALLQEEITQRALVTVVDKEAVEAAYQAGLGNAVKTEVGYKLDPRWGEPIEIQGVVRKLAVGEFQSKQIGTAVNMGRCAVIQIGHIFLVVCERSFNHLDPGSYRALGLEPTEAKIVGVKSTQHFRAFYGEMAEEIHLLDMKGPSSSNFKSFEWQRLTRPMWPLDEIDWRPQD